MCFINRFLRCLAVVCACSLTAAAQSRTIQLAAADDPRGPADLVVCSQNLKNFGKLSIVQRRSSKTTSADIRDQAVALARRFIRAKCDVIAVQEALGSGVDSARAGLDDLSYVLQKLSNRYFDVRVGQSNDKISHLGYLVAKDRAEILSTLSYSRVELPKLSTKQKPRLFARGPFEIQLKVKPRKNSYEKVVTLVNFHFKSKRSTTYDPTGLQYETYRMEMAEGLRRIVEERHLNTFKTGETLLVLLGDRNSNFDVASARILEGILTLSHFKEDGVCRMSKRGMPLCQPENQQSQRLFSVFSLDPHFNTFRGTYRYKSEYSWLDDILLTAPGLSFAWSDYAREGDYDSGVIYDPKEASDHALIFVRLNW